MSGCHLDTFLVENGEYEVIVGRVHPAHYPSWCIPPLCGIHRPEDPPQCSARHLKSFPFFATVPERMFEDENSPDSIISCKTQRTYRIGFLISYSLQRNKDQNKHK